MLSSSLESTHHIDDQAALFKVFLVTSFWIGLLNLKGGRQFKNLFSDAVNDGTDQSN